MNKQDLRPVRYQSFNVDQWWHGFFHEYGIVNGKHSAIIEWPDGKLMKVETGAHSIEFLDRDLKASALDKKNVIKND